MSLFPPTLRGQSGVLQPRLAILIPVIGVVLAFRIATAINLSTFIVIPPSAAWPLAGLGLLHLVCGVWVWLRYPTPLTRVFLLTGIGGAIHWGGSLASTSPGLEIAFLTFYMAVTAIGDGALLDLSLRYPPVSGTKRIHPASFYILGFITFLTIPIMPFLAKGVVESALGLVITLAFLMSMAGGVIFLVKWFRATAEERREFFLTPVVLALVGTSIIDLLADENLLPGQAALWPLVYGLVPLVFVWAFLRSRAG